MRVLMLFLAGLCAYGRFEQSPPADEKVRVYFYASPTTWGYSFKVYSDQTLIARFRSKKYYFVADLEPGRHLFHANSDVKHGITVVLAAGREYFVACSDDLRPGT